MADRNLVGLGGRGGNRVLIERADGSKFADLVDGSLREPDRSVGCDSDPARVAGGGGNDELVERAGRSALADLVGRPFGEPGRSVGRRSDAVGVGVARWKVVLGDRS